MVMDLSMVIIVMFQMFHSFCSNYRTPGEYFKVYHEWGPWDLIVFILVDVDITIFGKDSERYLCKVYHRQLWVRYGTIRLVRTGDVCHIIGSL